MPLPWPPASRHDDPSTSKAGERDVAFRVGSQRHRMLSVYGLRTSLSGPRELTADEAMRLSGLAERSCYWKRVSELVAAGLLEDTGKERLGEQGSMQRVNRITTAGVRRLNDLAVPRETSEGPE